MHTFKKYKKIFLTFVWVYHNADAKPDKDITKYNPRPMSLMNINAKIHSEMLANCIWKYIKTQCNMIKWDLILGIQN